VILKLREEEEGREEADDCSASSNVTTLATKVPSDGVEQARSEVDYRDLGDMVGTTANTCA
jgi:hypothetical protein